MSRSSIAPKIRLHAGNKWAPPQNTILVLDAAAVSVDRRGLRGIREKRKKKSKLGRWSVCDGG